MLRLSPAQSQAITAAQSQTAFAQLATHCRTFYPDTVCQLTDETLINQLHSCHSRAQGYGLTSRRDLYRFVNLALSFGWEFDRDANLPWMRQYLTDPRVDSPAQRLELLVKYAIHRLEIEETNRALRQAFAPALSEQNNPYSGDQHEAQTFEAIESNLLFPNPCWVNRDAEEDDSGYEDDDENEFEEEGTEIDDILENETELTKQDQDTDAPNEPAYAEDYDEIDSAVELNLNGPSLLFNRHAR